MDTDQQISDHVAVVLLLQWFDLPHVEIEEALR